MIKTPAKNHPISKRLDLLISLAWLNSDPIQISEALDEFEFDSPDLKFQLELDHFKNAFDKWHSGKIPGQSLVNWAEAVELRDDIEVVAAKPEMEEGLKELLLTLSNPDLFDGNFEQLCNYCSDVFKKIEML
jgi:hypothetical protein